MQYYIPQLKQDSRCRRYIDYKRTSLKFGLKYIALQLFYYSSQLAIQVICYLLSIDNLSMIMKMFILLIVLNIVTIIEKIYLFYYALICYNSVEPFYFDSGFVIAHSFEFEIMDMHPILFGYQSIRKLFEFGLFFYSSITFYQYIEVIQQESQIIYVFMIIYLIIRGSIFVMDVLFRITWVQNGFCRKILTFYYFQDFFGFTIIYCLINLAEIIYLVVILIKNQAQCNAFDNFFYFSIIFNSLFLIRRICKICVPEWGLEHKQTKLEFLVFYFFNFFPVLFVFQFIFCCLTIVKNLDSKCELGDYDSNLQWAYTLYSLIYRGIVIGLIAIMLIVYLIGFLIIYSQNLMDSFKQQNQIVPINTEIIRQQSDNQDIISQLTKETLCIICLQEFVKGDKYFRLKCNSGHIYHKECISDWLKRHKSCPKCRAYIEI